jgi:hypothetical protein
MALRKATQTYGSGSLRSSLAALEGIGWPKSEDIRIINATGEFVIIKHGGTVGLYFAGSNATSSEYIQGQRNFFTAVGTWPAYVDLLHFHSLNFGTKPPEVDARNDPSRLSVQIKTAFSIAKLDDDARECAARARDDALGFAEREIPFAKPAVDVCEDGVVILQWRRADAGVMLVFIGDGTLAYSVKTAGGTYGASVRELPIASTLPETLRAAIEQLDPETSSDRAITLRALP